MVAVADTGASAVAADPLGFMDKLSPSVYLYRPTKTAATATTTSSSPKPPKFIIVMAWMGARPAHIAKYIAQYRDGLVFGEDAADRPTVLLIMCHEAEALSYPKAVVAVKVAVPVVREVLGDGLLETSGAGAPPELLVHILSNGGCMMLGHLYNLIDPIHKECLPPHVTIFDSSPGLVRYFNTVAAFATGLERKPLLQRLIAMPAIHAVVFAITVRVWINGGRKWLARAGSGLRSYFGRRSPATPDAPRPAVTTPDPWIPHNDRTAYGGNRREVRRAYLYSDGDKIIESRDVKAHAAEARERGFTVARMVEFPGSSHVSHARTDGPRYWRTIKEVWEGREE